VVFVAGERDDDREWTNEQAVMSIAIPRSSKLHADRLDRLAPGATR
jgi:hypothetical protein